MKLNKHYYEDLQKVYEMGEKYKYNEEMVENINVLAMELKNKIKATQEFLYCEYMELGLEKLIEKYFEPGDVIQIRDFWNDIQVEFCGNSISKLAKKKCKEKEIKGVKVYYKGELKNEIK